MPVRRHRVAHRSGLGEKRPRGVVRAAFAGAMVAAVAMSATPAAAYRPRGGMFNESVSAETAVSPTSAGVAVLDVVRAQQLGAGSATDGAVVAPAQRALAVGTTEAAPVPLGTSYLRTGLTARALVPAEVAYLRSDPLPLVDDGVHDAGGVRMALVKGLLYNHPVAQAGYGVDLVESYRLTRNRVFLDRALAQAKRLVARKVVHGTAWFYPYPFDFALHGDPKDMMRAPWYSGMAQGLALTLFVRLAQMTGDPAWGGAADATFASFRVGPTATSPWVSRIDGGRHLWIEEYARWPATLSDETVNGFQFAIIALDEYATYRHNAAAWALWDGAMTTLLSIAPKAFNAGWASRYCLQHKVISTDYHVLVTRLFSLIEREGASAALARVVDQYTGAYPTPVYRTLVITMRPGVVIGHKYSSTGAVTATKKVTLRALSQANADSRLRIHGGPIGYHMVNGALAGFTVAEKPGYVVALGRYVATSYLPPRAAIIPAGVTLTGVKLSAVGGTIGSLKKTFRAALAVTVDSSETVNGRRWVHLVSGPLAGYWVPVTSVVLR